MNRRDQARPHLERADAFEAEGRLLDAAHALTRALEVDPEDPTTAVRLARCHETMSQWSYAVEAWQHAFSLAPIDVTVALGLAEALRQGRCHVAALTAYDQVLRLDPHNVFGLAGRAETLRMIGQPRAALRWFEASLRQDPNNAFALRGRAAVMHALCRWEDAVSVWTQALELEPDSRFALAGREECRRRLQQLEEGSPRPDPTPEAQDLTETHADAERAADWGHALMSDGRYPDAIASFQRAIELHPQRVEWLLDLSRAQQLAGLYEDAVETSRDLFEHDPDRLEWAFNLAEAEREAGLLADAILSYQRVLQIDDRYAYAFAGIGECHRLSGVTEAALAAFDKALALDSRMLLAVNGKAASLAAIGHHAEAIAWWEQAQALDSNNEFALAGLRASHAALGRVVHVADQGVRSRARVHLDLGRAWLQQDRVRDAVRAFEKASETDPSWDDPWYFQGLAWEQDQQLRRAVRAFEACLVRHPEHVEASIHRALCLRRAGDAGAALQAFEAAADLAPHDLRVIAGRAESLRLVGRFEDSLKDYDAVIAVEPRHFLAVCGKASALSSLHRFAEARDLWQIALDENPTSHIVRKGLAHCELQLGRDAEIPRGDRAAAREALEQARTLHKARQIPAAIECCHKALEVDPSYAEAALRLGILLEDDGRFREAIAAYERCLTLDPNCYQAATNIGEAHRKSENYLEALAAYDRALTMQPEYLYALAGRAESMRMLGQYSESLLWFNRALAQEPRHTFAVQGKAAALNSLLRFTDALPLWNKALEIDARSKFAIDGKAVCEAQLRRSEPVAVPAEAEGSEATTPTLDEQGRDLTALAQDGKLGKIIGRDREIRSLMKTLVRRQKANPILLGEPGVGKTAVVEGLAIALASEEVPERLRGLRIVELSMGTLVAGTKYRGTFEDRLKTLIKEASEVPGTVLFIDEIHTLVGAGRTEGGSLDAANILKPALARGEIMVIGATTLAEYRRHIEPDSALERRFQPITVEEPTVDQALDLLRGVVSRYIDHHGVEVEDGALHACVQLSSRYMPDRRLPDKALDLLDESCAEASLEGIPVVTSRVVAQVLSQRTGIPVHQLTAEERERLGQLEDHLETSVIGQHAAVHRLARSVRLCRSGLRDPSKPRGVFMFVGPSGVGKTELARQLSRSLFPEGNALIRFDMSEFSEKHTVSRLIGAPPGYAGHGEPGQLSEKLRRKPYAVVLLDEFEKAHPEVQTLFLSLFDEGHVTDTEGRKVDARQALFILTSNAGADAVSRSSVGFGGHTGTFDPQVFLSKVKEHFRPELLNRLDDVVPFLPLDEISLRAIAELHLNRLAERALERGLTLTWADDIPEHIASVGRNPAFGARAVLRALDNLIAEPLGQRLMVSEPGSTATLHVELRDGEVEWIEVGDALAPV